MEELDLDFPVGPYSLEDLSSMVVSCQIWEGLNLTQEVRKSLDKLWPSWRNNPPKDSVLKQLTVEISNIQFYTLHQMGLAKPIKMKINHNILKMVERAFNWIIYLKHGLSLDYRLTEKIYWMPNGLIDEDRIFKNFWVDNFANIKLPDKQSVIIKLPGKGKLGPSPRLLLLLSCIFAQMDFINSKLSSLSNSYKIMNLVTASYNKSFQSTLQLPEIKLTSNIDLLLICKKFRLYKAFCYFWNCLNEIEKCRYLDEQTMKGRFLVLNEIKYGDEYLFQIVRFLMREMTYCQKHNFILHNLPLIIFLFSNKEQFTKFCIPLLEHFLPMQEPSAKQKLLINCLKNLNSTNRSNLQILNYLLEKIPGTDKIESFLSVDGRKELEAIFDDLNFPALRLILNDKDLNVIRFDLLKIGKEKFKNLMETDNFETLHKLMNEILTSENDLMQFKTNFNYIPEWVETAKFNVVDRVLLWMHEQEYYNNKIRLTKFCYKCTPVDSESMTKLIKFYFGTQEPLVISCQDQLVFLKEFSRDLIFHIWFRGNLEGLHCQRVEVSEKILSLVFGSKWEIKNFKRSELGKDVDFVKFFCKTAVDLPHFRSKEPYFLIIDEFYSFVLPATSKVFNVRKAVSSNIDHWVVEYGVRPGLLTVVVPLIDWAFGKYEDNRLKLKIYFENSNVVDLYYKDRKYK